MNEYTDTIQDEILNRYFRDQMKEQPYPLMAKELGFESFGGFDDLIWKLVTGYGNPYDPNDTECKIRLRREYKPTSIRKDYTGNRWYKRHIKALVQALEGEGQLRVPKCDVPYIASILGRSVEECQEMWNELRPPVGSSGFSGLGY